MKEPVATAIFAAVGLITLVLGGIFVRKSSSRPPTVLFGTGIAALMLAATYVTLASLLRTGQQVGLWAPGLTTSIPTALSTAGTTAVSVWVALWAADQNRVGKFIADEAAIIRDLDGALRLLDRRSVWLREFWLGPNSPAVRAGKEVFKRFSTGEAVKELENYTLFGTSGIAQQVIESLFDEFSDKTVLAQTETLSDATKRLVALEIQTGLPMQPLLGDVDFLTVVTSCLDEEVPVPVAADVHSRQEDSCAKSLLRLQLWVILAACYWHASENVVTERSAEEIAEQFTFSQGQWWQESFEKLSERPSSVAAILRRRYGKSPLTGYEAIKAVPLEDLREAARLWRMFILAPCRRKDVLDAIRLHDPEREKPRSFSQLSHMMFWQKVREDAHLEDEFSELIP